MVGVDQARCEPATEVAPRTGDEDAAAHRTPIAQAMHANVTRKPHA